MSIIQPLETEKAIPVWNKLALENTRKLTIAHNPALFHFFTNYLKWPSYYFIITDGEDPTGLLPIVKVGKKLNSIPHFSYGGIVGKQKIEIGDEENIIRKMTTLIEEQKLQSGFYQVSTEGSNKPDEPHRNRIEVRGFQPMFNAREAEKVVHVITLNRSQEEIFNSFASNLKRKINKSVRNGIQVRFGNTELLGDFAKVYNKNMHHIGSPTLGRQFFQSLVTTRDIQSGVFVAYLDKLPIGGSLVMWYDGYYENTWFSTLREYNNLYTSYLLHWEMIKHACGLNVNTYSMGRSTIGSGVHRYKSQWPAEERKVYFNRNFSTGFSLKDQHWLKGIWKNMPRFIVDAAGPAIAKNIY